MSKKNKNLGDIIKKIGIYTLVLLVAILIGLLLAGNNKQVKKLGGVSKGEKETVTKRNDAFASNQKYSGEIPIEGYNATDKPGEGDNPISPILSKELTPKNYSELMSVAPYDLIPQHQESYREALKNEPEYDSKELSENKNITASYEAKTPKEERDKMRQNVIAFIKQYETFNVSDTTREYSSRIRPFVLSSSLADITKRKDNRQPKAIGLRSQGGTSGSKLLPNELGPISNRFEVLQYNPRENYAYVDVYLGVVKYTGPDIIWEGAKMRRSYGLVLNNKTGEWKIARVASDTLGPLE